MASRLPQASASDPSKLPAFDRVMRAAVKVPKAELEAELLKDQKRKAKVKAPKAKHRKIA